MKYTFTFIIYAFSICFLQNIAVAKDKVSVNVSVNKSGISVSLSKDNKATSSNEEKSNSQTSPSFQNTSNQKSLSNISDNNTSNNNDNNDNNSSDTNGNIEDIKKNNKINNWKLNQKEIIANTVKDIKNKGYASKQDFKIIDDELNKKIKQIAKKIDFEFDSNDGIQSVEFFNVSESNLEKIVKKTEIIDYIQKTFEVMGIIR
jgi:hypothetical protein